ARALPALVAAVEDRLRRDGAAAERRARAERIARRHAALAAEWQAAGSPERAAHPPTPPPPPAPRGGGTKDADWVLANGAGMGAAPLGLAARAGVRRQWRGRTWLRPARRARRGSGPSRLGQALRQSPGRRRSSLRGERPLHGGPSSAAALDRHVQQPHVRQR